MTTPTALTIAGSDSGGGAGIQADLKTFSALGVFGTSAITAITAQNTRTVAGVEPVSDAMVAAQIDTVLADIRVDAIKIGMLATPGIIATVAGRLAEFAGPVVLDPVMVAKSGDTLLEEAAVAALVRELLPRATLVTPNLPEAARLSGTEGSPDEQGAALLALGAGAALVKGGHGGGPLCRDVLVTPDELIVLESSRLATANTHGTGCSLSSAVAAELAKGAALEPAVRRVHDWLHAAIRGADGLDIGGGHGPVHHFHEVWT